MIVLKVYQQQSVRIGKDIKVKVIGQKGRSTLVGIKTPSHMPVVREELKRKMTNKNQAVDDE